jgi:hypothetical protein
VTFHSTHLSIVRHIPITQPIRMGQNRPSLVSAIITDVLEDISKAHPKAARRALECASYAESLLSRIPGYQSTDFNSPSWWSRYKPSEKSSNRLSFTRPSGSRARDIIDRLAAKYKPSNRLTMGTCTSFCPSETQHSSRIEPHTTQTTACTGTESPSATQSEQHSVSAAPPSYEDMYPQRLGTPNSERKANRRIDILSSPKQYQPSESVSIAATSPTETKYPRNQSETSDSSRESSLPKRPGQMDATPGYYPVQGELPGYPGFCRGDSGGPSIGSGWNFDGIAGGGGGGGGGGIGCDVQ